VAEKDGQIVVTGSSGRLGRALLDAAPSGASGWGRRDFDLDRPGEFRALVQREQPDLVIHAAAMTDVDACAREPALALRRNGEASGVLAQACRDVGAGLVLISSNEVFDGRRSDGQGYGELAEPQPQNPYAVSKLAAEEAARAAYAGRDGLWVVRTAWLFGPPGGDFPDKIVAAADRLPPEEPLPVVVDEYGNPSSTADVAAAIFDLMARSRGGLFHVVNSGAASRLEWAELVLAHQRPGRAVKPIPASMFDRPSTPPAWGVLDVSTTEATIGRRMRPWQEALEADLKSR